MKTFSAIAILTIIVLSIAFLAGNKPQNQTNEKEQVMQTELKIEDLKIGEGEEVKNGNTVKVHYTGTLLDGTKFDSSLDRNEPFEFPIGQGMVIEGWEKGLIGMKVEGKRKLTIPAEMGYGPQEVGSIPANSTLIFDIELLEIK